MHLFVSPIPFCALAFVALTLAAPPIHLPTTSSLTSNLTLPDPASRCNTFDTWIGAGITKEDCQAALNELWWADVDWRKGQKYEFLRQGVSRHSDHPWVTTPRKHWYGTCVVEIVMLDTFSSHSLPGSRSILPTLKSDTATFNQIWDVANEVFKTCVKRRNPYAGWGWAGASDSIGVFIMRNLGPLDKTLIRDMRTNVLGVDASGNGNATLVNNSGDQETETA